MSNLFVILLLLSLACLVAGLIKPTIFNAVFKKRTSRKMVGLCSSGLFVLFFVLIAVTAPASTPSKAVSVKAAVPSPLYKVAPAGTATITTLLNYPAGAWDQIYPAKLVEQTADNYSPLSPIPPKASLEPGTPSSLLSFVTSSWNQQVLVSQCYDTWAVPTADGGALCGTETVDGDPGQCTFWALLNFDNPNVYKINSHERLDASQFFAVAQANGLPTSQTPSMGAIVIWAPTPPTYGPTGHAGVVVGINKQKKTFVVSEMNYNETPWRIDYRVVSSVPGGNGYGNLLGFILPK